MEMERDAPVRLGWVAGAGVFAALASEFLLYSTVRGMSERFGADVVQTLLAATITSSFVVWPLWAVCVTWISIRERRRRGRREERARRGACLECGYLLNELAACPECGSRGGSIARRIAGVRVVGLLAGIVAASVLGAAAGEALILRDERAFRRESAAWEAAGGKGMYVRNRAWPIENSALIYNEKSFSATD